MNILDVGCGIKSGSWFGGFTEKDQVTHVDIVKRAYHTEAQLDIRLLAFQDNTFDLVHASHIIEHIPDVYYVLAELKRVSKRWVVIKVPNSAYYRTSYEDPSHLYSWNESTFKNLLATHFTKYRVYNSMGIERYEAHSKIRTVKRLILTRILKHRELIGVCQKTDSKGIRQVSSFPARLSNEPLEVVK